MLEHLDAETDKALADALEATLLFHSGGPWDAAKQARWLELTGVAEATTKALCDHLRAVVETVERARRPPRTTEMGRTFGKTTDCAGCRFWSEMMGRAYGGGPVEALCLGSGKYASKYTTERTTCDAWKSGHLGAVDDPLDYGETTRAAYAREEG
jgi:hypothetical protein